jgi:hypothetical protein
LTKTPLDLLRDRLAIARVCLQESAPRTTPFIDRLLTIDKHLSEGDDRRTKADIVAIITELGDLRSKRHCADGPTEKPVQDPSEELPAGVANAIVQLSKSVDLLE